MTAQLLMTATDVANDRDRWLSVRRGGITASEIPAMLGICHPDHGSPFALYTAKKHGTEMSGDKDAMMRGRHLEPYVAERFAVSHEELAVVDGGLYCNERLPWQMATFDKLAVDLDMHGIRREISSHAAVVAQDPILMATAMPVQIKTAHMPRTGDDPAYWWGKPGTSAIPVDYRAQCLWEMEVADASLVLVPVLFMSNWQMCTYVLKRDDDTEADIKAITGEAERFLERLADDEPPEIDWTPATARALKTIQPVIRPSEAVIPKELADRYRRAKRAERDARRRVGLASNQILARMGSAMYAVTPPRGLPENRWRVASRSKFERRNVPAEALRQRYPAIARELEEKTPVDALYASGWARGWEPEA